ncbi:MAG: redoxin domain-containing protein [Chloroflexi bacterium]|nr:redoxin domain-containing protein [Chloroflexota bacterium]
MRSYPGRRERGCRKSPSPQVGLNREQSPLAPVPSRFPVGLGQAAPDFTLPDAEGRFISLREYRGRKVILVFLRHFA